ncbi:glycosyltransferase family 4 protein, partial [Desulfobacterales bacterium HSG17]|nr:glycosyltransferase family 4 protein [Desulfobacterales bacterium HSG17]
PDIVNTHGNMDSKIALTAAYYMDVPCVIRFRHHSHPIRKTWHNRLLYQKFNHFVFTTAASISTQIIKDIGVPQQRVFTLGTGIKPPEKLLSKQDARKNLVSELGLDFNSRFIGSVAMLRDWKGHLTLIGAFDKIKNIIPDCHLVIVGEGDFLEELKHDVLKRNICGRVHFTGYKDNPWPYFQAFDCNVLASTINEGIPQVLLQAMAVRCPVIGTNIGGIPDIICHDETGQLVDANNSEQMAEKILKVFNDQDFVMQTTKKAFIFVIENYTLDIMGKKTINIYKQKFLNII